LAKRFHNKTKVSKSSWELKEKNFKACALFPKELKLVNALGEGAFSVEVKTGKGGNRHVQIHSQNKRNYVDVPAHTNTRVKPFSFRPNFKDRKAAHSSITIKVMGFQTNPSFQNLPKQQSTSATCVVAMPPKWTILFRRIGGSAVRNAAMIPTAISDLCLEVQRA